MSSRFSARVRYAFRVFHPLVYVMTAVILAVLIVWLAVALVSERHARRAAETKNCAVELAALKQRAPVLRTFVLPADDCTALRMVRL